MATSRQSRVVFLWHMHQPCYKSPLSGEYLLPWVLVHSIRDYYDMPRLASLFENVHPTFNLVPGLLLQIEDYLDGKSKDVFLHVALKDPAELTETEKRFLFDNFFSVHPETMLKPFPRYAELADLARTNANGNAGRFTDQDLADLQVWFFLAWTGGTLRKDERVAGLFRKGRGFTKDDKHALQSACVSLLHKIIPFYKQLYGEGRIEVSASPMYHPILPLLISSNVAAEPSPSSRLPVGFFAYPEDAQKQMAQGLSFLSDRMGRPVAGMWPPEGGVSNDLMTIADRCGLAWVATDEKMLFASQKGRGGGRADLLYTPWKIGNTAVFFRDAALSDLIGFEYPRWEPEAAVRHFIGELDKAAAASPHSSPVITIAMDGENAWEYYVHGGAMFIELLYLALSRDERFRVTTPSEVLAAGDPLPRLERLAAGSWIDGTFSTWIGDPVKNRAWEQLIAARNTVQSSLQKSSLTPHDVEELNDLVMRAETSDWFWWFGEGHSSRYDPEFDLLFRHHLQAIYRKLGLHPPEALDSPVDPSNRNQSRIELPVHLISPAITGRADSYYKWLSAGRVEASRSFLHRPEFVIEQLCFGYDRERLYFMIETSREAAALMRSRRVSFVLHTVKPMHKDFRFYMTSTGVLQTVVLDTQEECPDIIVAADKVLEASIPLCRLTADGSPPKVGQVVEMYLVVTRKGREVERLPQTDNIVLLYEGEGLDAKNWHV